jgi:CRISPR-associated protein Cas1
MAFTLMNRGALSEEDFLEEVGFCYLKEEGRKKVVAEFEERMRETVQHPRLKRPVSYRTSSAWRPTNWSDICWGWNPTSH